MLAMIDCMECGRFHNADKIKCSCDAFPNGIPDQVIWGRSHREPIPGDHGIQFEQK
jgi:hypothetical protein